MGSNVILPLLSTVLVIAVFAVDCAAAALPHALFAVVCAAPAAVFAAKATVHALVPQAAAFAISVAAVPPAILMFPVISNVLPSHFNEFVADFKDNLPVVPLLPIKAPKLSYPLVAWPIEIYGEVSFPYIVMFALPEAFVPTFIVCFTNDSLNIAISAATK